MAAISIGGGQHRRGGQFRVAGQGGQQCDHHTDTQKNRPATPSRQTRNAPRSRTHATRLKNRLLSWADTAPMHQRRLHAQNISDSGRYRAMASSSAASKPLVLQALAVGSPSPRRLQAGKFGPRPPRCTGPAPTRNQRHTTGPAATWRAAAQGPAREAAPRSTEGIGNSPWWSLRRGRRQSQSRTRQQDQRQHAACEGDQAEHRYGGHKDEKDPPGPAAGARRFSCRLWPMPGQCVRERCGVSCGGALSGLKGRQHSQGQWLCHPSAQHRFEVARVACCRRLASRGRCRSHRRDSQKRNAAARTRAPSSWRSAGWSGRTDW